jgi:hypothetical protein
VRLAKWYSTYSQKDRARLCKEITPMVLSRPLKLCNFLDWKVRPGTKLPAFLGLAWGGGSCVDLA